LSARRVLITGGSGRLGPFVVDAVAQGNTVHVLDLAPPPREVAHTLGDVTDLATVRRAMQDHDAAIHLAAIDIGTPAEPEEYFRVNVMGTWNVLQAAHEAGVRKVVLASSISASGVGEIRKEFPPSYLPIDEAHACHPTHAYGVSKLVGEQLARSFVDRGAMSVICLRPTAVMFPHTRPRFVSRAADPDHPWLAAWVTAADCARAFVLALDYEQADFDVFFITADDCASPMPTLDRLARLFAASPLAARDPGLYERVPQATCVDPTRARERLGWQATTAWSATPGA
jgi:nucleoside-diphosphate-sugar epimerase